MKKNYEMLNLFLKLRTENINTKYTKKYALVLILGSI